MEAKIKLLIVDDNTEFTTMLSQYTASKGIFSEVHVAKDGAEGFEMIESLRPDVVILDLIMPQLDGIGVLERLASNNDSFRPAIVVLSAIGQDSYVKRAMNLGASYYIVKPFDVDVLIKRIHDLFKESSSTKNQVKASFKTPKLSDELLESKIARCLHMLAIPPNLSGYRFIKEAIRLCSKDDELFSSVTKLLYPKVATNCSSTSQKVERSIRNAIDCAWKNETNEFREQIFGYLNGKPSNSQLISTIVELIKSEKI